MSNLNKEVEYELWQDDMCVAGAMGDPVRTLNEIRHYAAQYEQDGPIKLYEVMRREINLAAPAVANGAQTGELPPLPESHNEIEPMDLHYDVFTGDQMRAYARAAIAAQQAALGQELRDTLAICQVKYETADAERRNIPSLVEALEKIIEMNRQTAEHQYGDANKAESWACIKVARAALALHPLAEKTK